MRFALSIEYDGSGFHGWQQQPGLRTVEGELSASIAQVANEPVKLHCAGRTDSGVHALHQVVHFDTTAVRDEKSWFLGINATLPKDIALRWVQPVAETFHARHSAQSRTYRYYLQNSVSRPALWNRHVAWHYIPLELARMQDALGFLMGEHDFSAYRALGCQARSPIRTIHELTLIQRHQCLMLTCRANGFLYHMIRNIVGVLLAIGSGKRPAVWAKQVLESKDRSLGGVTAPACGLYLVDVEYLDVEGIPGSSCLDWDLFANPGGECQ